MGESNKFDEIKKQALNYIFEKHRKIFICGVIIAAMGGFVWWFFGISPYLFIVKAYGRIVGAGVEQSENVKNEESCKEKVLGVDDKKEPLICDFDSFSMWDGRDGFFVDNNVFKPIITENFSEGREMFCNKKIGTDFVAKIKFIPLNDKGIDVSINYGYAWRIIIGNGDYRQILVQANSKYLVENEDPRSLKGADWKDQGVPKWIGRAGFKAHSEIELEIKSSAREDGRGVHLDVKIAGSQVSAADEIDPSFDFNVKFPKEVSDIEEYLGIGIIESRQKNVEVKFDSPLSIQKIEI